MRRLKLGLDWASFGRGGSVPEGEVRPAYLSSNEQVHTPTVNRGAVTVSPGAIAAGSSIHAPTLNLAIYPADIAASGGVYEPTVSAAGNDVFPDHLAATTTVHAPTVTPGSVSVSPSHLAATTALHSPTLNLTIYPTALAASGSVFSPTVANAPSYPTIGGIAPAFYRESNSTYYYPDVGSNLASGVATQTVTTEPGKLYELAATGSGSITIAVGTEASGTDLLGAATYATTRYFYTPATTTHITVTVSSGSLSTLTVKEVLLGTMSGNTVLDTFSLSGGASESPTGTLTIPNGETADKTLSGLTIGSTYMITYLATTVIIEHRIGTSNGGSETLGARRTESGAVGFGVCSFKATATTHYLRFSRPASTNSVVSMISISEWTPGPTLRVGTFSDLYAYTCSSTTARTYIGSDGLVKNDLSADQPRFSYNATRSKWELLNENQSTNLCLYSDDLTNAAWTATNMTAAKTATGADGVSNSATTLTATAGNATILQAITSASATRVTGCWIKRRTGTGDIEITQNNGTNWTAVTVTSSWTQVAIPSASLTNPTVGIRIVTSGDAVDVQYFQHEAKAFLSSAIPTTGSTVTRAIENCRYSPMLEAIWNFPAGTALVKGRIIQVQTGEGGIIGFDSSRRFPGQGSSTSAFASYNGGNTLNTTLGSGTWSAGFGFVGGWDATSRRAAANGGSVSSSTATSNDSVSAMGGRSQAYLGRRNMTVTATNYSDGYYYEDGVWPYLATDANIASAATAP
jgi:hypothetical protein